MPAAGRGGACGRRRAPPRHPPNAPDRAQGPTPPARPDRATGAAVARRSSRPQGWRPAHPRPVGASPAARRDGDVRRASANDSRRPATPGRGRHVGLVAIPHGAKSYLAAALAQGRDGERLAWIARDAEIGDRVAEELGAWLGDPGAVAVLEPRTALAYERSELIADETAARVAALASWRSGRARVLVASVQALLQHTITPADLPDAPRELRPARGCTRTRCCTSSSTSATSRSPRSRAAASRPAAAASSTSSRRRCRCRSGSSSSATRSIRSAPSTRPTSEPSASSIAPCCCRRRSSSSRRTAPPRSATVSDARRLDSPSASRPTSRGSTGDVLDPLRNGSAAAVDRDGASRRSRHGRRRRGRGLGGPPRPGHRARPPRPGHPARHR